MRFTGLGLRRDGGAEGDPARGSGTSGEPGDFAAAYDDARRTEIGRFGVALFGLTGVGKSSLVNAVFGFDIAATGIGDPVTKGVNKYPSPDGVLVVWDFEGFELGNRKPRERLRSQINDNRAAHAPTERGAELMDVAWYAVSAHSRRLEEGQKELLRELHDLGMPVVLVLTQVQVRDGQVSPSALEFAQALTDMKLPIVGGRPVLTAAVADEFAGTTVHGLQDLLHVTNGAVPEGRRTALAASQRIDLSLKKRYARKWIAAATTLAGGVGFVPIPLADAAVLVPAQMMLMAKIAAIYGIPKEQAGAMAVTTTGLASQGGRLAAASLVGLIPGVGQVINATVASTITATIGESWRLVCERVAVGKLDVDDAATATTLADLFTSGLRRKVGRDGAPLE